MWGIVKGGAKGLTSLATQFLDEGGEVRAQGWGSGAAQRLEKVAQPDASRSWFGRS